MNQVFRSIEFLRHRLTAGDEHDIHSPFIYDLYTNIITENNAYYVFDKIESVRSKMLLSEEKILVQDFGTGGVEQKQRVLKLSFIARHFVKPEKEARLLFRLVNFFRPLNILELGTSLGITTLYLATPNSKSKVVTIEGCPNTAAVAGKNFELAGITNIIQEVGEFSKSLPIALSHFKKIDFAYFDGNHRKDATLQYFNSCLQYHHADSIFVFDDIYWSKEMADAWNEIRNHPAVTVSIDLYSMGIVLFRDTLPKQHFKLRF
ncbi:MAG: class I SAM-dependent methyltransferase [Bacteroidetes bacterium]|nr:class I SAM-dependent methyltransferase [Bacteroidota bacterium]